ncbi:glycosyltransferase family 2 protein [Candidatus Gracilibacteria bacterium]|nr:glycosyltransferase family 2 protein [Candidatus Gracilibacteria bacterium]
MRSVTKSGQGLYNPRISVIVPAWNEEVGVVKTIDSVLKNTYKNIELIIVNDGSIDTTHQKVMEYIQDEVANKRLDLKNINYIAQPNQGKGQALNNGIKASTGDIIMTIDADSALQPKAITNLVKYYLDPKIMCVVGNVKVAKNNTFVGLVQQLEYYFGFYFKRAYAILGAEYIFGGACASFRREVFDIIGYYDTDNKTEDIELSMRTRWAGLECTYAEDVVCYTEGASDVLSLVNQRVRWKKGRFDTFWRYRKIFLSVSKEHNSWLSFFILPYALLSELQLLFEPISISILITYSIVASDYLSFAIGLIFILQIYLVASFLEMKESNGRKFYFFPLHG